MNITEKIIYAHLLDGKMEAGKEIALKIDQTLCQDATGTLHANNNLTYEYVSNTLNKEKYAS